MKKTSYVLSCLMGAVFLTTAQAQTTTIDFSILAPGTVVTNQYTAEGLTVNTETSGSVLGAPATGMGGFTGGLANSATGDYPTTEFLNFNLTTPTTLQSFVFNDEGGAASTYAIYNASHTLIASGNLPTGGTGVTITVNVADASELQISNGFTAQDYEFIVPSITFGNLTFSLAGLDPNQTAVGSSINVGISGGNGNANFTTLVTALGTQANLGQALNELSPLLFGRFTSEAAFNKATFDLEGQSQYLAGRRGGANGTFLGGNGGIDSSGLTVNDPSYDSNLAGVHSRLLAWNPGSLNGAISDVAQPVLGGVDMKDAKQMQASNVAEYNNPWNFYVRGNGIVAQGFSQADTPHFSDSTESVELGVDYRINPNVLVGLTAGYGHTDVDLDSFGSTATVDSYSPGFYASYADHGWYANVQGDYVHNAYTQDRRIDFLAQTASSAPQGNEGVADLDGGYDFHRGAFTFGPLAGVQYTHLSVNGYTESGSIADLTVQDQESDSLRSRLGGRVAYSFTGCGLVFRPHFDASWQHEFMDSSRGITSSISAAGLGSFSVQTENPSRDFALTDLGIDADINRSVGVFLDYLVQAGQSNYFGQSFQGGAKIAF